jgi:hypothetical protein
MTKRATRSAAAVAAMLLAPALARAAGAQPVLVYDGRRDASPVGVRPADEAVLRRDVLPVARRLWPREENVCDERFQLLDAAAGSFTGRGLAQRAVLYRFCETGHDFARGGIAIVQGGRVVAHVTIVDAEPDAVRALADIDRNGRSEMVLVDHSVHQGEVTAGISILQLGPGTVRSFGSATVYSSDEGMERREHLETAAVVYVTPGARPHFERETHVHHSGDRSRWRGGERLHPFTLERDRTPYRRLR